MAKFLPTQKDFTDMLLHGDEQAIVRHLLSRHVPKDIQAQIVDEYNAHIQGINELRLNREKFQAANQKGEKSCQKICNGQP